MKITLKDILQLDQPEYRPSIEFAKAFLDGHPFNEGQGVLGVPTILDRYFDQDYTANLEEIDDWVNERSGTFMAELERAIDAFNSVAGNEASPLSEALQSSLNRNLSGEIDRDTLVLEVAELFAWMDSSPLWSGTAADRYWHIAKMQSAKLRLSEANIVAIDAVYDLQSEVISEQTAFAEQLQSGSATIPSLDDLTKFIERSTATIEKIRNAQDQMSSYSLKLGFLFRDAWWIENHGDLTIRGYLAKQTADKAGEGGAKQSAGARRQRIKYFLAEHAKLIGENPALQDDPADLVAFRALKQAIKKYPAVFKIGKTKKVAIDYWEYIRSDLDLLEDYKNILRTYGYLFSA